MSPVQMGTALPWKSGLRSSGLVGFERNPLDSSVNSWQSVLCEAATRRYCDASSGGTTTNRYGWFQVENADLPGRSGSAKPRYSFASARTPLMGVIVL